MTKKRPLATTPEAATRRKSLVDVYDSVDAASHTPKQFLIELQLAGLISEAQLHAGARRFEELSRGKSDKQRYEVLRKVLHELDTGAIRLPDAPGGRFRRVPTVEEIPVGTSAKQALIWLRDAGGLRPSEVFEAAKEMDAQGVTTLGAAFNRILRLVGARRVLRDADQDHPPAPTAPPVVVVTDRDYFPPADSVGVETAGLDDGVLEDPLDAQNRIDAALGVTDPEADLQAMYAAQRAEIAAGVHGSTVAELEPIIESATMQSELDAIEEAEQSNPAGIRKTLMEAIDTQRKKLQG